MPKSLQLTFSAAHITAADHPNKMKFSGVLVRLDEPSDKPPNGSNGRKIMLPSGVAKKRLATIVGMGLNYQPSLDGHAQRRKVGVINKAWIEGHNVCVEGTIWKHDFPEAEKDLKQDGLGMSMEIGDVRVEDTDASVWKITDFKFLGATILWKNAAAYHRTMAIAASGRRNGMATKVTEKKEKVVNLTMAQVATIAAQAAKVAVKPFTDILQDHRELLSVISARQDAIDLEIASGKGTEEDDEDANAEVPNMNVDKVKAAKSKEDDDDGEDGDDEDGDDDDDMDSSIDEGELEDMKDGLGQDADDDDEPGKLNKGTKNHGDDTTPMDKTGKNINKGVTGAAYKVLHTKLKEVLGEVRNLRAENAKIKKQMKGMNAQVIKASTEIGRRSVAYPQEVNGLLRRNGIDPIQLAASGEKKSVEEVDAMLQAIPGIDNLTRMTLKNKMVECGIMDEGRVDRGFNYGR